MPQDIYQVVVGGATTHGNFFLNVFHYQRPETNDSDPWGRADELLTAWDAALSLKYFDMLAVATAVNVFAAKRVNNGGGVSAVQNYNHIGTIAGAASSSGLCADIAWIGGAGVTRPGHTYVCGVPEGMIQNDTFLNAYRTPVDAFIAEAILPIAIAGGHATLGVMHRPGGAFDAYTHGQLRPKATMMNKRTLPVI